jgi:hypothetical protein
MTCILVKHNRDEIKVIYDYSIVIGQSNDFQEKTTKYKITCIVKKAERYLNGRVMLFSHVIYYLVTN